MLDKDKIVVCTVCPLSCEISISVDDSDSIVKVASYRCARGLEYARAEHENPVRTLTTTVRIEGALHPLLPVRTDTPIAKGLLFRVMEETRQIQVQAPVTVGDVIIPNVLGSGANLIATRTLA